METEPRPAFARRHPVLLACLTAPVVVGFGLLVLWGRWSAAHAANPPTCTGLGFGCSPGPEFAVVFAAVVHGLPALGATWLASGVLGWAGHQRSERAELVGAWVPVGVLACLATVTAVLLH